MTEDSHQAVDILQPVIDTTRGLSVASAHLPAPQFPLVRAHCFDQSAVLPRYASGSPVSHLPLGCFQSPIYWVCIAAGLPAHGLRAQTAVAGPLAGHMSVLINDAENARRSLFPCDSCLYLPCIYSPCIAPALGIMPSQAHRSRRARDSKLRGAGRQRTSNDVCRLRTSFLTAPRGEPMARPGARSVGVEVFLMPGHFLLPPWGIKDFIAQRMKS
ncbi:hypothetical protein FA95DRAFT_225532 [Auriscalpium vulgare]|uniref:Uncharacterized protein n=1 Tax=Auriscalpium vulgare TaxID=40419 RepID=A0ACB8RLY8_9AGAM|nr:hypothetical protein FA95DRAFT_225532 [Auriscalpium vulgare]